MAIIVKELEKIYSERKGVDVHALKSISFALPDTGMVFILGKSGCGKSTLLNLLGGLDDFDGGDIIVDGKSLKGSKAKDFDKYRNDYVGFVFQEHNLIEKESVRRNVSLALDLQSDKDTDGRVEAVLESVAIKELAEHKCNCISGGQKQRVAIARALIKQPKLLLCDEPTGALDSETGAEIFTLLKEVSKERLVVVVSHDRESAEKYGDRVIELKDGEIISDTAPYEATKQADEKPAEKKHGGLSFKRAFTMGTGYIIAKPVRMAICLILCVLTLVFVGATDAMKVYDRDNALYLTMENSEATLYSFGIARKLNNQEYMIENGGLSENEADEIVSLLDVDRADRIYHLGNYGDGWQGHFVNINFLKSDEHKYDYGMISGFVEADEQFLKDYKLPLVAGKMPEKPNEAAIPLYIFNYYKAYGYDDGETKFEVNSYEDIVGKEVILVSADRGTPVIIPERSDPIKVTGIVDTHFNYEKYAGVLFDGKPEYNAFIDDWEMIDLDIIQNTMFVCDGYLEYYKENYGFEENIREKEFDVLRVIAPYTGSRAQKIKNLRIYTTKYHGLTVEYIEENLEHMYENLLRYHLANPQAQSVYNAENTFGRIQKYATYLVPLFIVIIVLFLFYYTSGTVNEKRREIGILRATGASRGDIAKIMGCENGILAAGILALSSLLCTVSILLLNSYFTRGLNAFTMLINFGIRQFAVIAGIAVAAIIVGIGIPLIKLLMKKPVDIIADRK